MSGLAETFGLEGRCAVVTGAASGIGRATALRLAEAGASVVLADVDEAGLDATATAATDAGAVAVAVATDVADRSAVDALAERAIDEAGRLDAWVNVAGIIRTGPLVDLDEETFDEVMAVNLKGSLFGTQAALRAMAARGAGGSVVNTASAAIDAPFPTYGAYAMSKAAVAMLTRTAAMEGGEFGVRVNAVAPGFVETAMTARTFTAPDGAVDEDARKATLETVARRSPLRVTGEPDDVAWCVLYLVSDASRFVTGQILRPNGGTAMPW